MKNLPEQKGKIFLNSMYTDGYTCRISFCKKKTIHATSPVNQTALELYDFTSEEVDRYFRPCTVDPNRKDVFVSYHGNTDIRRLSSAEHYDMSENVNRQKMEEEHKKRSIVKQIEIQIPSPKTTSIDHYTMHITYMLQHMDVLFNFYSFETARINWCNYIGSQRTVESAVNILVNESKKYNKRNKRKRRKTAARYQSNPSDAHPNPGKSVSRYYSNS